MKRTIVALLVAVAAMAVFAGMALAQGPVDPAASSAAPGRWGCDPNAAPGAMGGMWGGRGMPEWAGSDEAVQELLGISAEELQAERLAGKSLVQIAEANGVTEQALIDAMLAEKKASLDKLVEEGKLTRERADLMLSNMEVRVKEMVSRTATGPSWRGRQAQGETPSEDGAPRFGGRGMRGGMMTRPWNR